MNITLNRAIKACALITEGELCSKVEGRTNWGIVYDKKGIIYHGGYGEGKRRGAFSWYLMTIAEREIRFLYFTYKKDYFNALKIIQEKFNLPIDN